LHVHSSNFRIVGFTESVGLSETASVAHEAGLPLIADNGSGAMLDTAAFGLAHEPTPADALAAGADIVTFSGDKLLGGPQAGIVLGRSELIAMMGKHPLARATRPDKLCLAALSATLLTYLRGRAAEELPVWRMISQPAEAIANRAASWKERLAARDVHVRLVRGESTVGGGSLPGETLATTLVVLPPHITSLALRAGVPPIVGRTKGRAVQLDLRTVPEELEEAVLGAIVRAARVDPSKLSVLESESE
jgi:L-seryl-tRNA(Ser) seleniumtransferase